VIVLRAEQRWHEMVCVARATRGLVISFYLLGARRLRRLSLIGGIVSLRARSGCLPSRAGLSPHILGCKPPPGEDLPRQQGHLAELRGGEPQVAASDRLIDVQVVSG
jgi:hypothetical protein